MTDRGIKNLVLKYRTALERAYQDGRFSNDFRFKKFPHGCCGDTCYMLGEFLKRNGIDTIWYSAQREDYSHAWLVVKDNRVSEPTPRSFSWPKEMQVVVAGYGIKNPEEEVDITRYEENDLKGGLIIDITGDQFNDYDESVFLGKADCFHRAFNFNQAHDYTELDDGRLQELYRIVEEYL